MEGINKVDQIVSLVEQYPLCAEIVLFFLEHTSAMDTAKGIAEWWLQRDLEATQEALHLLVSSGAVVVKTYAGINLYSFTTNTRLQTKLQAYFNGKYEG